jgi:GH35 family endo-1,4-beta-xylanase
MATFDQVPPWLGAAVAGAVVAALGYVAKSAFDVVAALRAEQRARRARLIALRSLLRASLVTFKVQQEKAVELIERGYSVVTQQDVNEAMLKWLDGETYFTGQTFEDAEYARLATLLPQLHAHLLLWRAKCRMWIPDHPEHALVYMADEAEHGLGFPTGLDDAVDEVLKRRPRLFR